MTLEEQVCSLDLAKQLKELGCRQESLWYWFPHKDMETHQLVEWRILQNSGGSNESCSAYTVAELGEMLPNTYHLPAHTYRGWVATEYEAVADTEADARAKMLCYLIEQKLIN